MGLGLGYLIVFVWVLWGYFTGTYRQGLFVYEEMREASTSFKHLRTGLVKDKSFGARA